MKSQQIKNGLVSVTVIIVFKHIKEDRAVQTNAGESLSSIFFRGQAAVTQAIIHR